MTTNSKIDEAELALKEGDKNGARSILRDLLKAEPGNDKGWLLFSYCAKKKELAVKYAAKAARLNPQNKTARLRVTSLQKEIKDAQFQQTAILIGSGFVGLCFVGVILLAGLYLATSSFQPANSVSANVTRPTSIPFPTFAPTATTDPCPLDQSKAFDSLIIEKYERFNATLIQAGRNRSGLASPMLPNDLRTIMWQFEIAPAPQCAQEAKKAMLAFMQSVIDIAEVMSSEKKMSGLTQSGLLSLLNTASSKAETAALELDKFQRKAGIAKPRAPGAAATPQA